MTPLLSPTIMVSGQKNRIARNTTQSLYPEKFEGMASIWLRECDESIVLSNDIQYGKESGIFLEDSDDNRLMRNTVCGDGTGIVIDSESTGNRLHRNVTVC